MPVNCRPIGTVLTESTSQPVSLAWPDRYFFLQGVYLLRITLRSEKSTPPVGSEVSRMTRVMEQDQTLFSLRALILQAINAL